MSVSKWAYEPLMCEGDYCVGDCDFCSKAEWSIDDEDSEDDEIEQDGWKTWQNSD